jgi:hypothetical protein
MKVFWIVSILIFSGWLSAQDPDEDFPFPVPGGTGFTVPVEFDTVWIMTHSQYKEAVKTGLRLEIADSMIVILENKTEKLYQIIAEKDKIIELNREGYLHYRELWEKTDVALENAEIEVERLKRSRMITGFVGALTTAIAVTIAIAVAK